MTAASGADPAEIVRQRAAGWPDFHPEDYCHACGRPNPTWFADTAEWQTATGSEGDGGGILCPSCFCALWEQVTGRTAIIWRLSIDPRSRDTAPTSGADQPTLRDRYWQCDDTCTVDCGACKGQGRPTLRDQLAEALFRADTTLRGGLSGASYEAIAHALLPMTERYGDQRATEAITDLCDDLDHGPLYAEATRYFADRDVDADGLDIARILRAHAEGSRP